MIDIAKTLFIVDGQTEICSIRSKFQKEFQITPEMRKSDCNGKAVLVSGYCQKILPMILFATNSSFENVVIIVDLEQRKVNANKFSNQIKANLTKLITENVKFKKNFPLNLFVCSPNRMFENWIVADVKGIKAKDELIRNDSTQGLFDGKSGTTVLKTMMRQKYKKTFHAETLFKAVDIGRAKENSPSFLNFCNLLEI
jgi:hypothetical protein